MEYNRCEKKRSPDTEPCGTPQPVSTASVPPCRIITCAIFENYIIVFDRNECLNNTLKIGDFQIHFKIGLVIHYYDPNIGLVLVLLFNPGFEHFYVFNYKKV